ANLDAGYTGLGVAEFVALAMHENTGSSGITVSILGVDDPGMLEPAPLLYGRASLVARGLLVSEDGETVVPDGIGRLVAHAAGNATRWVSLLLFTPDGGQDAIFVVEAPAGAMLVVPRALFSYQVAPANLEDGLTGLVWDILERHLHSVPGGAVAIGAAFPDGSASKLVLVREDNGADAGGDESFVVAVTDDLDDQPADAVSVLSEDELVVIIAAALRGGDDPSDGDADGGDADDADEPDGGDAEAQLVDESGRPTAEDAS
ncbi:MAG: hypothetical protein ACTH31_09570, partial [Pseudoclavibacter sp.]